jgi:hypothetical protein
MPDLVCIHFAPKQENNIVYDVKDESKMRGVPSTPLCTALSPFPLWNTFTLEWSPLVANAIESGQLILPPTTQPHQSIRNDINKPLASSSSTTIHHDTATASSASSSSSSLQFALPDLPHVYSSDDRKRFLQTTLPHQRIHTIAACHHTSRQSLIDRIQRIQDEDESHYTTNNDNDNLSGSNNDSNSESDGLFPSQSLSTILIVGGNEKGSPNVLTTVQAADVIATYCDNMSTTTTTTTTSTAVKRQIWGVENPNDPNSPKRLHDKLDAGIHGFLTQPLLSSSAMDTLHTYHDMLLNHQHHHLHPRQDGSTRRCSSSSSLIVGMALPTTANGLQFWSKLLEQPYDTHALKDDPLFQSHLAFFSQPYYTPLAWAGREIQDLYTRGPASISLSSSSLVELNYEGDEPIKDFQDEVHSKLHPSSSRPSRVQHGVHFMPLKNIKTLCDIFRWIWR